MKFGRLAVVIAGVAVVAAGCSMDVAKQLTSNEQMRTQVFDTIASNRGLATQLVDKIMANDTTRAGMVDHLLTNDNVAKQVLGRIATNPAALDMVLQAAVQDSAMRTHVLTLLKGIEMASNMKK